MKTFTIRIMCIKCHKIIWSDEITDHYRLYHPEEYNLIKEEYKKRLKIKGEQK